MHIVVRQVHRSQPLGAKDLTHAPCILPRTVLTDMAEAIMTSQVEPKLLPSA